MSNNAYLTCHDLRRTYPSFENPGYVPKRHTVAYASSCVPLAWLALFEVDDLLDDFGHAAPLTTRVRALARAEAGAARIDQALGKTHGSVAPHVAALVLALRAHGGRYVSVELEEIAALSGRGFAAKLRAALAGQRAGLLALSRLPARGVLPPVDLYTSGAEIVPAQARALACVLGTTHFRAVPWEKRAAGERGAAGPAKLLGAAKRGDIAGIVRALDSGEPITARDKVGRSALDLAVLGNRVPVVAELVRRGSPFVGSHHALPLAAARGRDAIVALLLEAGAEPDGRVQAKHDTALAYAAAGRCSLATVARLLAAGADPSLAIDKATREGPWPSIAALLEAGAPIEGVLTTAARRGDAALFTRVRAVVGDDGLDAARRAVAKLLRQKPTAAWERRRQVGLRKIAALVDPD